MSTTNLSNIISSKRIAKAVNILHNVANEPPKNKTKGDYRAACLEALDLIMSVENSQCLHDVKDSI